MTSREPREPAPHDRDLLPADQYIGHLQFRYGSSYRPTRSKTGYPFFLDIRLGDDTGFSLLENLPDIPFEVIL